MTLAHGGAADFLSSARPAAMIVLAVPSELVGLARW